jgi:DNA-binding response OmpR family regulator
MARILVVDDSRDLAAGIVSNLRFDGYDAEPAFTGASAIQLASSYEPDLILLDLLLPDVSGLAVLNTLRKLKKQSRTIILSALSSPLDRELAYSLGATEYISKPFSLLELLGIVKSILDCPSQMVRTSVIQINYLNHSGSIMGETVYFPPKEFEVLSLLVEARGAVVTKREFLAKIWHTSADISTTTVESHIKQIRARLKRFGLDRAIITVTKIGFRWEPMNA